MVLEEVWTAIEEVIENESKAVFCDSTLEFINMDLSNSNTLELTAAVVANNSRNFIYEDGNNSNNAELSFSRFLHPDFLNQPFVLVSKERKSSVTEDSQTFQKESTPTSEASQSLRATRSNQTTKSDNGIAQHQKNKSNSSPVWGSPLKCNIPSADDSTDMMSLDSSRMSVVTKKLKPKRLGVSSNWARKILSAYNVNGSSTGVPPVLVLCDGGDFGSTAISGVKLLQLPEAKPSTKAIKIVTVTVDGKGNINDWNTKLKIDRGLPQNCQAVYQVSTECIDQEEPWGTAAVEVKWKEATRLFDMPPSEASTAIKATVRSGSMQSKMNTYYQELQFLDRINTAIMTGEMEWMSPDSDKPTVPLASAVKALIAKLQEEGSLASAANPADETAEAWTFATAFKNFSIAERKDYDFTDRLWKVMVSCMSSADLVSSLRLVFSLLGHGELRPFVGRHNQTTVAQMVRESFTGRFSAPSLTGMQPFLFLAEIGAEKLRRDYIHIFASQCLATPAALEGFTAVERELQPKIDDLRKLHSVLEMVTFLAASLRLQTDRLASVAGQMLSHYRQNSIDPNHIFTFSVKTSEVRCVLTTMWPVMWSVEMTGKVASVENINESSLYCICASQPFFHLQSCLNLKEDSFEKEKVDDVSGQYYLVQRKERVIIV